MTDNYYFKCPPMADSRKMTDYADSTTRNQFIKNINGIWRDDEYRLYLQKEGKTMMDIDWNYNKKNGCRVNPCVNSMFSLVQTPADMIKQRILNDSVLDNNIDPSIKAELAQYIKCTKYPDYRLNP